VEVGFVPSTVAEHLLDLLGAHGIEHFFLNPGTDSLPSRKQCAPCLRPVL
jgi:acetolactate synthase I/II/III large subunit